jgi:hypothetical protein
MTLCLYRSCGINRKRHKCSSWKTVQRFCPDWHKHSHMITENTLVFCWNEIQSIRFCHVFNRHLNTNVQKINLIVAGQTRNLTLRMLHGISTSEPWHGQIYLTCRHLCFSNRQYHKRQRARQLSRSIWSRFELSLLSPRIDWSKRSVSEPDRQTDRQTDKLSAVDLIWLRVILAVT